MVPGADAVWREFVSEWLDRNKAKWALLRETITNLASGQAGGC